MPRPEPLLRALALIAILLVAAACRRSEPLRAVPEDAGAPLPGGAPPPPRESIAPLVYPGGHPLRADVTTFEDPHWAKEPGATVSLDETFVLEVGMGSGLGGLNVTTVRASGRASHVYEDFRARNDTWLRVDFEVQRTELEALVRVLNESGFLHLARSTVAKNIEDGAQWVVHLRTGGRDKYVYASNAFPEPLVAVARFVSEQLVDTRPELRERSRPVRLRRSYADHLWRGNRRYSGVERTQAALEHEDDPCLHVQVLPDEPLPKGARLEAAIVDRSAGGIAVAQTVADRPFFFLFYTDGRIDPRHHYDLEVKLTAGGKVLGASEPLAVLTYDGEHALEVPLPRP